MNANGGVFTFPEYFTQIAEKYKDLPYDRVERAMQRAGIFDSYTPNPTVQNRRVKGISSFPAEYGKNEIAEMLRTPDTNEIPLRQVSNILEYTAYPMFKIRTTYQSLLSYHNYVMPKYIDEQAAKSKAFMREYQLVEKIREAIKPKETARKMCGQAVRDGKAFYLLRYSIDKSHNTVNYVEPQQLPQDWVKIVGFNTLSKYTVAFNMMYFLTPGTVWTQYGSTFAPFIDMFREDFVKGDKVAFMQAHRDMDVYRQDNRWFYWVTLDPDQVWTMECDDVKVNAVSPLTGLMLAMAQISSYEAAQYEIVLNPLVSVLTGEIPYADTKDASTPDLYKLSPTGRAYFESEWARLLAANNTGGVGLYAAPFENLKLQSLAEAPNATNISSSGYSYAVAKSGLAAILPTTSDNRVGTSSISLQLESRFAVLVYRSFERMMNWLYANIGLKYGWQFKMFGSLGEDAELLKSAKEGMTLGILSQTIIYLAMHDHSLLDDISISNAVIGSGIMDKRIPLESTYSAKSEAGRPKAETVTTEGQEADVDDNGE